MKKKIVRLAIAVVVYMVVFCLGNQFYHDSLDKKSLNDTTERVSAAVAECNGGTDYRHLTFEYIRSEYETNNNGEKHMDPTVVFEAAGFHQLTKEQKIEFFDRADRKASWGIPANAVGHGGLHILSDGHEYAWRDEGLFLDGKQITGISGDKPDSWEYGRNFPIVAFLIGMVICAAIAWLADKWSVLSGKTKPRTIQEMEERKLQITTTIWSISNGRQNEFYNACQKKGVKDLNDPKQMKIALNILKYDQRFASLPSDEATARAQYERVTNDSATIAELEKEIKELDRMIAEKEVEKYGKEGYQILQTLRKDASQWKQYRDNGISAVYEADHVTYYVFAVRDGLCTYCSGTRKVHEGKPTAYIEKNYAPVIKHVPGSATYTSATVGGVTTGGWTVKEAHDELGMVDSGTYHVSVGFGINPNERNELIYFWPNAVQREFVEYNDALLASWNKGNNRLHLNTKATKEYCSLVLKLLNDI